MKLKNYCKENNYNCGTCNNSFKNHFSIGSFRLYCTIHGFINENNICIDYESRLL